MKIGKIQEATLKRAVLKAIKYRDRKRTKIGCGVGIDAARIDFSNSGDMLFSTETVACPMELHKNRAVIKACNNIAAAGGRTHSISISIMLPEYVKEKHIKALMKDIVDFCQEKEIIISGGHTEVSEHVSQPVVTISAVGSVLADLSYKHMQPGMSIVMSKAIGMEATVLLAEKNEIKERFSQSYVEKSRQYIEYLSIDSEAAVAIKHGVAAMHDLSENGIFGALWEIGEASGLGLSVNLKDITVCQETIEFCEYFNINPYNISSGGALLMITDNGEELVKKLEDEGIPAKIIGNITDIKDKVILNDDEKRYLEPPRVSYNDIISGKNIEA